MTTAKIISDEIARINQLPADAREQVKLDFMIALMEGETANSSASIYVPLLAGFAIAVGNTGINPIDVLKQLFRYAQDETNRLLKEQGITSKRPLDG